MLERAAQATLLQWKHDPLRKPLLIRGARQVGKSSLVEHFGRAQFKHHLTVNFELQPELKTCFETLQPKQILSSLQLLTQQSIDPGQSLLFLDEIQDCPNAIRSLRYFKEQMPELHVIGAGSLLELVLSAADFRMPVGRIHSLYLYPLTFYEFLVNIQPELLQVIDNINLQEPPTTAIHEHLLRRLHEYLFTGGMPEAIAAYLQTQQPLTVQQIQADILETYEKDIGHFATKANLQELKTCFKQVPLMLGEQIKYNKIDPSLRSRELKQAISVFEEAHLFQRIEASSAQGLPLDVGVNSKKFKLNFIDVGLAKKLNQLDAEILLNDDIMLLNKGAIAEQFVGQELAAYSANYEKYKSYFWARDKPATAEVDYLHVLGGKIYPIEVKAGTIGKMRSMQQYLLEHDIDFGIRISQQPLSFQDKVLSVPLYLLNKLPTLVSEACSK